VNGRIRFCLIVAVILPVVPFSLSGQQQNDAADAARLIEVLNLRDGSTVADIGAGFGELTVRMARHVGSKGVVFSTDTIRNGSRIFGER
jgi:cyclopropane fatty-acyl-phospholipid synthase-like methyltransferase